jgi:hypothetical protein
LDKPDENEGCFSTACYAEEDIICQQAPTAAVRNVELTISDTSSMAQFPSVSLLTGFCIHTLVFSSQNHSGVVQGVQRAR